MSGTLYAKGRTLLTKPRAHSKKSKRVYFQDRKLKKPLAGAVGLWGLGVRPEDKIVSAFDYSFWCRAVLQLLAKCWDVFM